MPGQRKRRLAARRASRDAWHNACAGKNKYASREQAEDVRRHQEETRGVKTLQSYECPRCGRWHLGNRPASEGEF